MKKYTMTAVVVVVIAVGLWLVFQLWPKGPEAQITHRCRRLAERVSFRGGSESAKVFEAYGMQDFFAPECRLTLQNFKHNGVYSRDEITAAISRVRSNVDRLHLSVHDLDVEIDAEGTNATVRLTARFKTARNAGSGRTEAREILCNVEKVEGTWRFTGFKEVAVLEK